MHEGNDLTELRRSSIISLFGPGSIIDFLSEGIAVSGIATGLEAWDESFSDTGRWKPQRIREPRLEKKLEVINFRLPPVLESEFSRTKPDLRRLRAVRFPTWLQCPKCEFIKPIRRWKKDPGKAYRFCPRCSDKTNGDVREFVVPVRFVLACKSGHLDEFPWDWWVQHKPDCKTQKGDNFEKHEGLLLKSEKPGLAGLILSCPECKKSRSMDGVFSNDIWKRFNKCRGRRPWLTAGQETCKELHPIALQRGASNLYFPAIESALSIPPWSDLLQETLGDLLKILMGVEKNNDRIKFIELHRREFFDDILKELDMTAVELSSIVEKRNKSYEDIRTDNLKYEEYRQFTSGMAFQSHKDKEFETRYERVPSHLSDYISNIIRAVRLREVRVLKGFTRINPPSDIETKNIVQMSKRKLDWLPGIEVRGEGIFIELNSDKLIDWENNIKVKRRVEKCNEKFLQDLQERYGEKPEHYKPITPRFMLCHTLAHVLMSQLTLECGYSAADLKERIYAEEGELEMAGLLIYTASTDADGTLGGLERQGKAGRFQEVLINGLKSVEWCSSDPLCISDSMNAIESYSSSVCHACCLAPETACESFNRFLDRGLIIGDTKNEGVGYFEDMLKD